MTTANPSTLPAILKAVKPGDEILLRGGTYSGAFTTSIAGRSDAPITIRPYEAEPVKFVGPASTVATWVIKHPYWQLEGFTLSPTAPPTGTTKPGWIEILVGGVGALLRNLTLERGGNIADAKRWNDHGVGIQANDVTVSGCRLSGMTFGINPKGACLRPTIVHNHIGPTYQSSMAVGSSEDVVRAMLIAWNIFEKSYIEDGIQFMPRQTGDTHSPEHQADISNLGTIIFKNEFRDLNENALDLKGAALVVIDGNTFTRTAGSLDGPINGWNHKSPACIMRGANASSKDAIVRNNDLTDNGGGIRVYEGYKVIHNRAVDNNYSPEGTPWQGWGISQIDQTRSAIKNNLARGNLDYNVEGDGPDVQCNPTEPGPGVPLTKTKGAGSGRTLPLVDAGYFTDWFGRTELPPDVLYLGTERYTVQAVDYGANTVVLDRDAVWQGGQPVFWRSPEPMVGLQAEYIPQPEPPIVVEPPVVETVRIVIEVSHPPAEAAQLRELLAGATMKVE